MIWNVASGRDGISLRKWSGGAAHLRTFRGSISCIKCVLLAAMLLFNHVCLHIVQTRGGQTCSLEESFAENQIHQRAAKPVCNVIANMVKKASFPSIDVQQLSLLSFCLIF